MKLTITAAQRDALYDQILDRLSGVGDIELALQKEDYEDAERLGQEYSDDLCLLLNDLGFGEGSGEPVVLSSPPEVLRRVLPRLRDLADRHAASQAAEWTEANELRERNRLVSQACGALLESLGSESRDGGQGA